MRNPEFCVKCGQIKPYYRDVVGMGWIVCECDKEKDKEEQLKKKKEKSKEPFVFKDNPNE